MPPSTLPWAEAFVFFVPLTACAKLQRNTAHHPDDAFCDFDCRRTVPLQPSPYRQAHTKYKYSLLVLPSVNAILNFATEIFEMLTKKQSEHPQTVFQVFQVFRVFQVFHFAFGPQNSPFLVQIQTKPKNRYPPTSAIKWVRKTPKKAIHPLVYEHDPILQAIGAVFFRRSRLFVLFHLTQATIPPKPHQIKHLLSK